VKRVRHADATEYRPPRQPAHGR